MINKSMINPYFKSFIVLEYIFLWYVSNYYEFLSWNLIFCDKSEDFSAVHSSNEHVNLS